MWNILQLKTHSVDPKLQSSIQIWENGKGNVQDVNITIDLETRLFPRCLVPYCTQTRAAAFVTVHAQLFIYCDRRLLNNS